MFLLFFSHFCLNLHFLSPAMASPRAILLICCLLLMNNFFNIMLYAMVVKNINLSFVQGGGGVTVRTLFHLTSNAGWSHYCWDLFISLVFPYYKRACVYVRWCIFSTPTQIFCKQRIAYLKSTYPLSSSSPTVNISAICFLF